MSKPKAIKLADDLELCTDAATELRRLHVVNAELLEVLQKIMKRSKESRYLFADSSEFYAARAAITKATGGAS